MADEEKRRQYQYHKDYYQSHREVIKQKTTKYRREHPEMVKQADRKIRARYKMEVFTHYSDGNTPACANCRIDDIDVLVIDHINGGGAALRRNKTEASNLVWWLKKNNYPSGYQVLCANCNQKKSILQRRC